MIGIIGAMEEEVSQLIEAMEEKEKVTCAGMDFYCGKLKDKEDLIELAKKTCDEVNPDIHSYVGRVVSGDQFISDNKKKHYLINEFDGYCAEMEGAAMAQAAHLNQIPFIILRAISDKADQEAAGSYEEFEKAAIKHIVRLVLGILDRM